jgi:hypothetical protein
MIIDYIVRELAAEVRTSFLASHLFDADVPHKHDSAAEHGRIARDPPAE